jgi:Lrp/AsnC family transcriptional regulator, leucine-responsive regulatory protein
MATRNSVPAIPGSAAPATPRTRVELDDFDRRILVELQQDNLISAEHLGAKVGLSASAIQRRMKRLRDGKVISADVSVLDPEAIGRPLKVVVEVSLERESLQLFEEFKRRIRDTPEVQQCYYVTGEGDFVLIITAVDMSDYQRISEGLFREDRNVKHFRTSVVLSSVKASLAMPVE